MVRVPPSKVDEEVQKQNEDFYGGDDLEPKNPDEALEDFIGNKPSQELDTASELKKDEEGLLHPTPPKEDLDEEE